MKHDEYLQFDGLGLAELVRQGEVSALELLDLAIARIEAAFAAKAAARDETDGLSLVFDDWRLNLRRSNTEPLLRLNVEARGKDAGLDARVAQLVALIGAGPQGA